MSLWWKSIKNKHTLQTSQGAFRQKESIAFGKITFEKKSIEISCSIGWQ